VDQKELVQILAIVLVCAGLAFLLAAGAAYVAWRARKGYAEARAELDRKLTEMAQIEKRYATQVTDQVQKHLRTVLGTPESADVFAQALVKHPPFLQALVVMVQSNPHFMDDGVNDLVREIAKPETIPADVKRQILDAVHKAIATRAPDVLRNDEAIDKVIRGIFREAARELPEEVRRGIVAKLSEDVISRVESWIENGDDEDLTEIARAIVKELGVLENLPEATRTRLLEVIGESVVSSVENWANDDDDDLRDLAIAAMRDVGKLENLTPELRARLLKIIEDDVVSSVENWAADGEDDDLGALATAALRDVGKLENLTAETRDKLAKIIGDGLVSRIEGILENDDEELEDLVRAALKRVVENGTVKALREVRST
jgi:hypothetical protein